MICSLKGNHPTENDQICIKHNNFTVTYYISWHSISLFITNIHHQSYLSSSLYLYHAICIHQTLQYINYHSVQSLLWHIHHTHFLLVHSSNSICYFLVRIFLTFFQATFTADVSFLHYLLLGPSSLTTPIPHSFPES